MSQAFKERFVFPVKGSSKTIVTNHLTKRNLEEANPGICGVLSFLSLKGPEIFKGVFILVPTSETNKYYHIMLL